MTLDPKFVELVGLDRSSSRRVRWRYITWTRLSERDKTLTSWYPIEDLPSSVICALTPDHFRPPITTPEEQTRAQRILDELVLLYG